jgi:hypothetical protein
MRCAGVYLAFSVGDLYTQSDTVEYRKRLYSKFLYFGGVPPKLPKVLKKCSFCFASFFLGRGLHYRKSTTPPKNGPGVSQARVPTHTRAGGDHAGTQQLPSCRCRRRSRPSRHHQGGSGRQSRSSGRRGRSVFFPGFVSFLLLTHNAEA